MGYVTEEDVRVRVSIATATTGACRGGGGGGEGVSVDMRVSVTMATTVFSWDFAVLIFALKVFEPEISYSILDWE